MNRIIIYLFLCLSEVLTLQNQQRHAVVRLEPNNVRISKASGIVRFSQKSKNSPIKPNSKHGFHIHQFGDLSQKCQSLGTHYNPFNKHHGGFDSSIRHVGDFGNLIADKSGNIYDSFVSDTITLFGQNSIIGRSVVLHEKEDDLGKGNDIESLKTGNAGGRFACGVIGLAKN